MKFLRYFKRLNKLNPLVFKRIYGPSMAPSLKDGQIILVSKHLNKNLNNRVVVFSHQGIDKIKRVSFVSDDKVYLLGDNLKFSSDSRQFGLIDKKNIVGQLIWPKI